MGIFQKILRPKSMLVLYVGTIVIIFWLAGLWCTQEPSSQGQEIGLPLEYDQLKQMDADLRQKEEQLSQQEERLSRMERELRIRYPDDMDKIDHLSAHDIPKIYAITPTYARPVQKAELTRLIHTFLHLKNFHWVVVEDSPNKTNLVTNLLRSSGLSFTHLNKATPTDFKLKEHDPNWLKARGVLQRNEAIDWLINNVHKPTTKGVVFFADDDNVYSLKVFDVMRDTKIVSVWPVGLVGKLLYEMPIVKHGEVVGWRTWWERTREFASDMAGFAINIQLFFDHPKARFNLDSKRGYLESDLLKSLEVEMKHLEPKADMCTKILVWHTRTEKPNLRNEAKMKALGLPEADPNMEV